MSYDKPKKLIILYILDILNKYSDENHRLNQKDIMDKIYEKYGIEVDRKTIKRNMEDLINHEYKIGYDETERLVRNHKTKEDQKIIVRSNFYIERDITDGELRLLIESVMFSKHIPHVFRKSLIEKLKNLSSEHFSSRVKHSNTMNKDRNKKLKNYRLFWNIENLEEAINKSKKVSFKYNRYGVDENLQLKFEPQLNKDGSKREYIVNPYQIVSTNGRYYLICNNNKYDNLSHYRLDRITDVVMLKENCKSMREVKGLENGLDLSRHMDEHIYMFSGDSQSVRLKFKKHFVNEFIDWFGTEKIKFIEQNNDEVSALVLVNRNAMRKWALQYSLHVRVLSPRSLVDEIREDIIKAQENYK